MRLQKFLAHCGIASRRKCEIYIQEGRIKVNGIVIKELGYKVNPGIDKIEFQDKLVQQNQKHIYIILNKPIGYVTTVNDQFNRKTIMDIVSEIDERIYPVGRLDYDTEGLLIMTNDGEMTYQLTHPKHEIEKEYIALVKGVPSKEKIASFKTGLAIEDYITSNAEFSISKVNQGNALVRIIIHEGKNRQIRKMCDEIGHPVITLKRIRIGEIHLGGLPLGKWRFLTDKEVANLINMNNSRTQDT